MRPALLAAVLLLSACHGRPPGPSQAEDPLPAGKRLDIKLCLSQDTPKRKLGAAIRHRFYAERIPPFRRVHLMPQGGLTRMCDIIATLTSSDEDGGTHSASVASAYSHEVVFSTQAAGGLNSAAAALGDSIFAAVAEGTPLHTRLVAERSGHRAAHPMPPGAPAEEKPDAEEKVEP